MHDINPKPIEVEERILYGHCMQTSLTDNKTSGLWRGFRQRCAELGLEGTFYSATNYPHAMKGFNPTTVFDKWAVLETDVTTLPEDFQHLVIPAGNYIHFTYKGTAQGFPPVARYIFTEWLPNSPYELDDRPHFELLPEGYNPFDENAEEEVYIPVK